MTWLIKILIGIGGLFVLLAIYSAISNWLNEQTHPPSGAFVTVDGQKLHFVNSGKGNHPFVLLHGSSSSLRDFEAGLLKPLAEKRAVFAFDRPGYGYSERRDNDWPDPVRQAALIHDALVKLGVEKPILVGHSWAGSVVLAYLLEYPDEVGGGVLLAGAVNSWKSGVAWFIQLADLPVIGSLFTATLAYPLGQLLIQPAVAAVFKPDSVPSTYVDDIGAVLALRPGPFRANAQDLANLSDFLEQQSQRYDTIQAPLLLITGKEDTIVPAWNHAHRLIKRLPHAKLVELENAGHALHHSRKEEVAQLLLDFATEIDSKP